MKYNYQEIYQKYLKFKSRLDKAIQNGSFTNYTYKKRQMLLKRLDRLKRQLDQLNVNLKTAATGTLAAGMMMLNTSDATAQEKAEKVGSEFKINTNAGSNNRINSSIAIDDDGDFVVTWGFKGSVYAQRYNASGETQGDEFLVDDVSGYATSPNPQIAMSAGGEFVITWDLKNASGLDSDNYGVYAKRYNANGEAQGDEFLVNTYTSYGQKNPDIAIDDNGNFVIVWTSYGGFSSGGDEIVAQRFDALGNKQGNEFRINTSASQTSANPSIAMDSDGDFVITWQDEYVDGDDFGIEARIYNASGVAQTDEFLVNTSVTNYQTQPDVAMDSDGDFVITWKSDHDNSYLDIYAQRYNASGIKQGDEFLVNTFKASGSGSAKKPSVAMNSKGEFVITWDTYNQEGNFTYDVYAQRYNSLGVAQEEELLVNSITSNNQKHPSVGIDNEGDFIISWYDDQVGYNLYAQRYMAPRFAPKLESIDDKEVKEEELISFTTQATDANSDELIYSLDAGSIELGMIINSETGEFSWTPSIDQSGTYDVTVTVSDGDLTDSEAFKITVSDKLAAPDGVSSVDGEILEDVTLFPNPATSEITLNSESSVFDSYEISDLSGGLVQAGNLLAQKSISIADLPTGVYMLKVSGIDGVKTMRFIKK
ncbi:putative Ig domain-containing protein [Reichenbachiella versicolor]|uniref:putative Ig domain-containing protein n=1 Tax=Reichenbachiella versicolor TaxID=1821036 RepID=UPI000D6E1616|nr:putative Ig domain-containing protein [Reichenbachiella versicolor]